MAIGLCMGVQPSAAEAPNPVQAQLIIEEGAVQPSRSVTVAVRLIMDEGWHTYWKNPGDAGMATSIHWRLPAGVEAGQVQWPVPERIETPPLVNFGYHGSVWLLSDLLVPASVQPATSLEIRARVDWVACRDICVKGGADLQGSLPIGVEPPARDPTWQQEFSKARMALPVTHTAWRVQATVKGTFVTLYLQPPVDLATSLSAISFFPEEPGVLDATLPRIQQHESGYALLLKRSIFSTATPALLRGVLVVPDGWNGPGSARGWRVEIPVTS